MTDRHFRLLLGLGLLILLYFDQFLTIGFLIVFMVFEGLTNWRLPLLANRLAGYRPTAAACAGVLGIPSRLHIPFEAERMWRLAVSAVLYVSLFVYPEQVWWLSWFVAFTVLGAGISGVCPMLIALHMAGFR
jgi:hypothetical protein